MTDYNKWAKFDVESAEQDTDRRLEIEDSQRAKKKAFCEQAKDSKLNALNAKKAAEALESKNAVEALKAKGAGRRRRQKASPLMSENMPTAASVVQGATTAAAPTPSQLLNSLTEFLYSLLKTVEDLRSCTELKTRHAEGFALAVECMDKLNTFSRIKGATVEAVRLNESNTSSLHNVDDHAKPGEASSAALKIIGDLDESEVFLVDQVSLCAALFALSIGEYALSADLSRFILKRQGSDADAGVWILRGLAFVAMGAPTLARLHFSSASSANKDYKGLQSCIPLLEEAEFSHAAQTLNDTIKSLVGAEITRCIRNCFADRQYLLQEVPDLAVLTATQVQHFIDEGSLPPYLHSTAATAATAAATDGNGSKSDLPFSPWSLAPAGSAHDNALLHSTVHLDDEETSEHAPLSPASNPTATATAATVDAAAAETEATVSPADEAVTDEGTTTREGMREASLLSRVEIVRLLQAHVLRARGSGRKIDSLCCKVQGKADSLAASLSSVTPQPPPPSLSASASPAASNCSIPARDADNSEQERVPPPTFTLDPATLHAILLGHELTRRLFYEAQMVFLESLYKTAEVKYMAAAAIAEACIELLQQGLGRHGGEVVGMRDFGTEKAGVGVASSPTSAPVPILDHLRRHFSSLKKACCMNVATAKAHRLGVASYPRNSTTTLKTLESAPALSPDHEAVDGTSVPAFSGFDDDGDEDDDGSVFGLINKIERNGGSDITSLMQWCRLGSHAVDVNGGSRGSSCGSYSIETAIRRLSIFEKAHMFEEGLSESRALLSRLSTQTPKGGLQCCYTSPMVGLNGAPLLAQRFTAGFFISPLLIDDAGCGNSSGSGSSKSIVAPLDSVLLEDIRSIVEKKVERFEFMKAKYSL